MSDMPDQTGELFIDEPGTRSDGSATPPARRRGNRWPWKLELPGLVALAEGLALLCSFSLLPWFFWNVAAGMGNLHLTLALRQLLVSVSSHQSYSGWAIALGLPLDGKQPAFWLLWLVPLAAAALLILAWLRVQRRIPARPVVVALLALSALALLVETGFYAQVQSLQGMLGNVITADVSWGFWTGAAVSVAGLAGGVLLFAPARFRLTLERGSILQPGNQA